MFKAKIPCWTIIYSATSKDGDIKTGEAYSNAISAAAAKADVNAKLSRIGYSNISILAIEATDSFNCNAVDSCDEQEDIEENDMLRNRPHNAHIDDPKGVVSEDDEDESDDGDDSDDSNETADSDTDSDSDADSSEEETEDADEEDSEDADGEDDSEDSAEEDSTDDTDDTDSEEEEEESDDDAENEDSNEDSEGEDSDDEDSEDEDSEDEDEDDEDPELDANEKAELKDKYRKTFKNVLSKCKFECSFNDLTLEQKVKFFTELSKAWTKNEPTDFMTDKEVEQLNNVVVKEGSDD
jgi:hypothetical protein